MERDEVGLLEQCSHGDEAQAGFLDKRRGNRRRVGADHRHPERPRATRYSLADVPYPDYSENAFSQRDRVRLGPQAAADILIHPRQSPREAEDVAERSVSHRVRECVGRVVDPNAQLRRGAGVNGINARPPLRDDLQPRRFT
jgi:hypothetical protein